MAAFSYQHPPFLLDSVFFPNPNTPTKLSGLLEEGVVPNTSCLSCYSSEPLQDIPVYVSDNETSVTEKYKNNSSSIVMELEGGDQVSQKTPMEKKRKNTDGSCLSFSQSKDGKESKAKKQKKFSGSLKKREEKNQKKVPEESPTGYIHVRARRGQATDSHSLAERVRREKISERMKLLQDLVPGCDKVTGKALMLDEIINYVQSLQNQVEFLSMKLASVNSVFYDFGVDSDAFLVKSEKMSSLASLPLPSMQQSIPFADTSINNYPLLDNSVSFLFQLEQRTNAFYQDNENLSWYVDEQRQRFINQLGFNNLCSFQ